MVDGERTSLLVGATVTAYAVQRNRDPPPTTAGIPQWDTDKVVALMLRSHTVVLAAHSRGVWFGCMEEGMPCARGAGVEGWAVHQPTITISTGTQSDPGIPERCQT